MRTLAAALLPLALLLAGCGQGDQASDDPRATSSASSSSSATSSDAAGACTYTATGQAAKKVDLPPSEPDPARTLTIGTDRGPIRVTLDGTKTPCTASSFTSLARQGYFDGTRCHRLTTQDIFVLQCGDPTGSGSGGPGYSFPDELSGQETNPAGTLAMANAGPDTTGSQFFLVYASTPLPPSYTVFGTVDAAGLKVVRAIARAGTTDGGADGAPKKPVVIQSVK
jgi:peptidyl-prolyl cis-trans isomerase B (cyclophilin B)